MGVRSRAQQDSSARRKPGLMASDCPHSAPRHRRPYMPRPWRREIDGRTWAPLASERPPWPSRSRPARRRPRCSASHPRHADQPQQPRIALSLGAGNRAIGAIHAAAVRWRCGQLIAGKAAVFGRPLEPTHRMPGGGPAVRASDHRDGVVKTADEVHLTEIAPKRSTGCGVPYNDRCRRAGGSGTIPASPSQWRSDLSGRCDSRARPRPSAVTRRPRRRARDFRPSHARVARRADAPGGVVGDFSYCSCGHRGRSMRDADRRHPVDLIHCG